MSSLWFKTDKFVVSIDVKVVEVDRDNTVISLIAFFKCPGIWEVPTVWKIRWFEIVWSDSFRLSFFSNVGRKELDQLDRSKYLINKYLYLDIQKKWSEVEKRGVEEGMKEW